MTIKGEWGDMAEMPITEMEEFRNALLSREGQADAPLGLSEVKTPLDVIRFCLAAYASVGYGVRDTAFYVRGNTFCIRRVLNSDEIEVFAFNLSDQPSRMAACEHVKALVEVEKRESSYFGSDVEAISDTDTWDPDLLKIVSRNLQDVHNVKNEIKDGEIVTASEWGGLSGRFTFGISRFGALSVLIRDRKVSRIDVTQ